MTGKTAIVTGGSRGIGKEMAEALAEAGANLMLCARRAEWLNETVAEFTAKGCSVDLRTCDVAKPGEVQMVVDKTVPGFGSVYMIANSSVI